MNIAMLASGGVDSSVAVYQLKEAGYTPTLFYIRIGMEDKDKNLDCHSQEDIEIVTYIARKYGCPMEIVSLHNEYWEYVMGYAFETIKRGLTPNPDVMCNKFIKFGFFEKYWGKDFDKILFGRHNTIDLKTFSNIYQMRGSKEAAGNAPGLKHTGQIGTGTSFAVGTCHMDHTKLILRIAQKFKQLSGMLQRMFCRKFWYFFYIFCYFLIMQNDHHFIFFYILRLLFSGATVL